MNIFTKVFGDTNQKFIKNLEPSIKKINALEPEIQKLSSEGLKEKTKDLKERFLQGEPLDDLLNEAFALAREAGKRTLNQRHFDVQLIGGMVLHKGSVAEMRTGEGKTLTATLPTYLNALTGKGVHIITVNDYLAKRDMVWMGQIYNALGLTVSCITHEGGYIYDENYKQEIQNAKIKNQNDNVKLKIENEDKTRDLMGGFKLVENYLKPVSKKEAYLADITYGTNHEFGFDYLRDNMDYNLADQVGRGHNFCIVDEVDSILIDEARVPLIISGPAEEATNKYREFTKVVAPLQKDTDYVVKNGEIIIIDEFTGRMLPGRRWSAGLHQAVEAKENVKIQAESVTYATITFQNYFRLYKKISGMTGTALTSAEELDKVYKLDVRVIPTNKPTIRKDLEDKIYKTEAGKFKMVVQEIKELYEKGQPVLVATKSVKKNEFLGKLLEVEGIPHQILNAKNHEREGEIIAQAGRQGAVTIATNMAGRGVDIILGGNPVSKEEAQKVKELGGLHVIGTERHDARRIDNQLRGRAGRQGDPGSSQFFVSLEDDLMRIFG